MNRLIRAALWLAVIITLWFAWSPAPPTLIPNDKLQHALAFVTLTLLGGLAYPRLRWFHLLALAAILGAVIEWVQAIPFIGRDCDIQDWYADMIAAMVALILLVPARAALRLIDPPADAA